MDTKTNLTIQDYIKNTNINLKKTQPLNQAGVSAHRQHRRFGQILAATQAAPQRGVSTPKGMTLASYRSGVRQASVSRARQMLGQDQRVDSTAVSLEGLQSTTPAAAAKQRYRGGLSLPMRHRTENFKQVREKIERSIEKAALKYNLSPALLHAMVKAESNYEVRAISAVGARGLMQLMPETAKDLGVTNPFDIDQNISGGAQYMRWMLDRFNGNLELALAAYNAGPETVVRHGGQVPPYNETRTYIQRVTQQAKDRNG